MKGALNRFGHADGGSIAATFAAFIPVGIMLAVLAVDYGSLLVSRQKMQSAADSAALAAAKELSLSDATRVNVAAVVNAVIQSYVKTEAEKLGPLTVSQNIVNTPGAPMQVRVEITMTQPVLFNASTSVIRVDSVASIIGKPNLCLLALDPSAMGTIYIQKNAAIDGRNCSVFSNSTHSNGINAFNSSVLKSISTCSAGGYSGGKANFQPAPFSDCPTFTDPLAGRPEPSAAGCTETSKVVTSQTLSLAPGTYCGGLTIDGASNVTLRPGLYVMKDGPLRIDGTAQVTGVNTGFYFTGSTAALYLGRGTTISLTAPKDGPLSGILFFASRSQNGVKHQILSDNARQVLGTIYLPTGELSVDANKPIADQSAYTAIIVKRMTADSGPTVVLNTNYDLTDIPVPDGIRGAGQPAALIK